MNVFVTGGTGFIGSHLTRALVHAGHKVLVLSKPESDLWQIQDLLSDIEIFHGSLENQEQIREKIEIWRPDTCLHLAWFAEPINYLHSLVNIESLKNSITLVRLMTECDCEQFIGAGTCAEYQMISTPLNESDRTEPETLYAASKQAFLLTGTQIAAQTGMKFAWGRIFHLYGPHENLKRLVPAAIVSLTSNRVFQTSPGEQVRDYLHVTDVARAFTIIAQKRAAGIFNICSSIPITLRFLLEQIGEVTGKPELLAFGAIPYRDWEPMYICGDNKKLSALGWSAEINLMEGINKYTVWLQNH